MTTLPFLAGGGWEDELTQAEGPGAYGPREILPHRPPQVSGAGRIGAADRPGENVTLKLQPWLGAWVYFWPLTHYGTFNPGLLVGIDH